MPLALDFGTSSTVAAFWDTAAGDGHTLPLADLTATRLDPQGREYHSIPSIIHYHESGIWAGQQVHTRGLEAATPGTFRWMKTNVGNQMKLPRNIAGRSICNFQAAADFLTRTLLALGVHGDLAAEEIAITLPVEAFEHYQLWLDGVLRAAGLQRPRYLDEATAAALGYAAKIRPGAPYMTFDFGGGTLDVSIVRADDTATGTPRTRVLGKAGAQIGGGIIDQWLARDAATRAGRDPAQLRTFMPLLLQEAERVKETLSTAEAADFTVMDPATGTVIHHPYTRTTFEDLLEKNGLYAKASTILDTAEAAAREHGYDRDSLAAVLMIGGSSLIPSIRRLVRTRYGERARSERPFDAVAVGAAACVAGAGFDDRIRHAYALRPYDRATGTYIYKNIIKPGTPYPCEIMRPDDATKPRILTIKATNDQQTRLALQVYEVADATSATTGGGGVDLVFDQNGAARYQQREDIADTTHRPIGSPTAIPANPPAALGEPRFLATFSIDASRHLCATVQDTKLGKTLLRNQPLVKLT